MAHQHAYLVKALGDGTKLAAELTEAFGEPVDKFAVYKWKKNGVPWPFRHKIARLAKTAKIALPPGFLGEAARIVEAAS